MKFATIEHVRRLDPEILTLYANGTPAKSLGIPAAVAAYIDLLGEAHAIYTDKKSIHATAQELHAKTKCGIRAARSAVSDAITFFNTTVGVPADAWNVFFADQMADLSQKALAAGDYKEARICLEKSREYRLLAVKEEIDQSQLQMRTIIVSPDVEVARMGITKQGNMAALKRIAEIVADANISENDKTRLMEETRRELNTTDAEIINDDAEN